LTDLGLYIHVPFCRTKCDWCAFASEEGARLAEPWLGRVVSQLAEPPQPDARWVTLYLGGGTPSLLAPDQLDRLLAAAADRLAPEAELTFEANPESLVGEHLSVLAAHRATRLSLGIQSFDEALLSRHHRATRRVHLDRTRKLVGGWKGSLSLDLICGLAGQTEGGQHRDLDEALDWEPDHLSFYALTVEPSTPLGHRAALGTAGLPEEDEAARWWLEGRDRLEKAGWMAYEVSNFARPGQESAHNGRYWAMEPWLGVGPSAASFLPRTSGGFEYRTEAGRTSAWLAGTPATVEVPTALDLAKDRLLAGIRRTQGVTATEWTPLLGRTLDSWSRRVVESEGRLFLSREAFPYLDAFLREAFLELDERPEFR
jgi:oxygen-independent coproporphyrinogen-3 oxidase